MFDREGARGRKKTLREKVRKSADILLIHFITCPLHEEGMTYINLQLLAGNDVTECKSY